MKIRFCFPVVAFKWEINKTRKPNILMTIHFTRKSEYKTCSAIISPKKVRRHFSLSPIEKVIGDFLNTDFNFDDIKKVLRENCLAFNFLQKSQ